MQTLQASYATIDQVNIRDDKSGVDLELTLHPSGKKVNARLGWDYEGNGFGLYVLPEVEDEVLVVFPSEDINQGVVVKRLTNKIDQVPTDIGHDKILLVGKTGHNLDVTINGNATIHITGDCDLDVDGNVTASIGGNQTATVAGNLDSTVTGTAKIKSTGQATLESTGTVEVKGGSAINLNAPNVFGGDGISQKVALETLLNKFNSHSHSGVQTGGGTTGPPDSNTLNTSDFSSKFKAV